MDDAVFAVDLVRGFGKELSGRLFAEDIAGAGGGGEEVGRVALAKTELGRISEPVLWRTEESYTHLFNR